MPYSYPLPFCGYQDPEALMKSVKLLQGLAQHHNHLQEQPQKALVDILSEVRAYQLWAHKWHYLIKEMWRTHELMCATDCKNLQMYLMSFLSR